MLTHLCYPVSIPKYWPSKSTASQARDHHPHSLPICGAELNCVHRASLRMLVRTRIVVRARWQRAAALLCDHALPAMLKSVRA